MPGAFDREEPEQTYKNCVNEIVSAAAPSPAVPLATVLAEGGPAESLITAAAGAELLVVGSTRPALSCPRAFGCQCPPPTGIFAGTARARRSARCSHCPPGR